jgi:hypothetical protein
VAVSYRELHYSADGLQDNSSARTPRKSSFPIVVDLLGADRVENISLLLLRFVYRAVVHQRVDQICYNIKMDLR